MVAKLISISFLIFLFSCGHPSEKCQTKEEMILRCQADWLAAQGIFNATLPQWKKDQCKANYLSDICY